MSLQRLSGGHHLDMRPSYFVILLCVHSLSYPKTSQDSVEVDQHARVVMTFTLVNKNKNTKKIRVHQVRKILMHTCKLTTCKATIYRGSFLFVQAFVRFSAGEKEIFYVTKHDSKTGDYSFELDVSEAAADFGSLSDTYSMVRVCNIT